MPWSSWSAKSPESFLDLNTEQAVEDEVLADTRIQEKSIMFRRDSKLRVKVIERLPKIENESGVSITTVTNEQCLGY